MVVGQGFFCISQSGSRGSLIFKIGKTGLEKLNSLIYLKSFQSMKNFVSRTTTNLNVSSCNFQIFGAIFMEFFTKM